MAKNKRIVRPFLNLTGDATTAYIQASRQDFSWDSKISGIIVEGDTLAAMTTVEALSEDLVFEYNLQLGSPLLYGISATAQGLVNITNEQGVRLAGITLGIVYETLISQGNYFDIGIKFGCTDPTADNYDPYAANDDDSCLYSDEIEGCMDNTATNYDSEATIEGDCEYEEEEGEIAGCMDATAVNYNPSATIAGETCRFDAPTEYVLGCTDSSATNYSPDATQDDGSCTFEGVTTQEGIDTEYEDSGAIEDITGQSEEDCTEGVWIDNVGCTGGIKPFIVNTFNNVDSKLNAYFELVEEVQYKLDDTYKHLDEARALCRPELTTASGGEPISLADGTEIDCDSVGGLEDYVEALEDKLENLSTDDESLTALLAIINSTEGVEDTYLTAESVGASIAELEAEIDTLEAAAEVNAEAIVELDAEIVVLEAAAAAVAAELALTDYSSVTEIAEALGTANEANANYVTLLGSIYNATEMFDSVLAESVDGQNVVGTLLGLTYTQEDGVSQANVNAVQELLDIAEQQLTNAGLLSDFNIDALQTELDALDVLVNSAISTLNGLSGFVPEGDLIETQTITDAVSYVSNMFSSLIGQISDTLGLAEDHPTLNLAVNALITAYGVANDGYTLDTQNLAIQAAITDIDAFLGENALTTVPVEGDANYSIYTVELIADIIALNLELAEAQTALVDAATSGNQGGQDIANLNATIDALNANIGNLESDIGNYQIELEGINDQLDGVMTELSVFDELSETLGTQLNELSNYLAKYGYESADFAIDETSSMYYETDDNNLVSVENDALLGDVNAATFDSTLSTGYQPISFTGASRSKGKWSNFCAASGQPNSINPLVNWGIDMKNFYNDNVKNKNMKTRQLSANGQLSDCGVEPNLNVINTGINMTVFVTPSAAKTFNKDKYSGVFFYAVNRKGDVVGASKRLYQQQSIAVYGKDPYMTLTAEQEKEQNMEMGLHLIENGAKEDDGYFESEHGVAEGEFISFRVMKRDGIYAVVDSSGVVRTKYSSNSVYALDGDYKLEPICEVSAYHSDEVGNAGGLQSLGGSEVSTVSEGYPTWMKAAAIVGGIYLLNKVFGSKK